ncbi:hypothetical protein F5884DRAFT_526572 [Xylogone sp. PMI_703]|nr:hypothetical protein F5884DRAFT_526572 [Xylogone sp. PMI_703]
MSMANGPGGMVTQGEGSLPERHRILNFHHPRPRTNRANTAVTAESPAFTSHPLPSPLTSHPTFPLQSPIPSRQDSLPKANTPTRAPQNRPPPRPLDLYRPSTAPLQNLPTPNIPQSQTRTSEASRLRALENAPRSQTAQGRRTPEVLSRNETFPRTRRLSIRGGNDPPRYGTYGPPLATATSATFPLIHPEPESEARNHNFETTRDRGLSTSSATKHVLPQHVMPQLRPSASIPDYQTPDSIYSRQRNLHNPHSRPANAGLGLPDGSYAPYRREPLPLPAGFDSEEMRASFRSALTTNSSYLGTSGTERSSILTKSSSATSLQGGDEGMSVDDAIGMYEMGFEDSGDEDDEDEDEIDITRPSTTTMGWSRTSTRFQESRQESRPTTPSPPPIYPASSPPMRPSPSIPIEEVEAEEVEEELTDVEETKLEDEKREEAGLEESESKDELKEEVKVRDSKSSLLGLRPPGLTAAPRESASFFSGGGKMHDRDDDDDDDIEAEMDEPFFDEKLQVRPATHGSSLDYDSTRDRYGFRKATQHVTIEQYEAWNGPYTEYLARRRKKWVLLMKESGLHTDHPSRFPPKSAKVKRFVRKGIPPDWRGEAWFYYAGGPAMIAKHPGTYQQLVNKAQSGGLSQTDDEAIERDLNRTFPDNILFKPDPLPRVNGSDSDPPPPPETRKLKSLRRVLRAFAVYNPKIGYCQSLNFLAGLLLIFMSEEKAFWMLNIITRVYLPGTHDVNLEGANVDLGVLMTSIKESMPSIWAKIGGELDGTADDGGGSMMRLPPITLCVTAWFMSCFIGSLPIETTLRVWDSFFYEGSKTIFRISMAIFKVGEQEIRAVNDPMEIFQVVQTIPRRLIDASALMEACFKRRNGFGHVSQDTIENRRKERRAGYAEERAIAKGELLPTPTHTGWKAAARFPKRRAKTRLE